MHYDSLYHNLLLPGGKYHLLHLLYMSDYFNQEETFVHLNNN